MLYKYNLLCKIGFKYIFKFVYKNNFLLKIIKGVLFFDKKYDFKIKVFYVFWNLCLILKFILKYLFSKCDLYNVFFCKYYFFECL